VANELTDGSVATAIPTVTSNRQRQRYDDQLQQFNKQQDQIKRENHQIYKQPKHSQLMPQQHQEQQEK